MIYFQIAAFPDLNNFCNNTLLVYEAIVSVESCTQLRHKNRQMKLLKATVHINCIAIPGRTASFFFLRKKPSKVQFSVPFLCKTTLKQGVHLFRGSVKMFLEGKMIIYINCKDQHLSGGLKLLIHKEFIPVVIPLYGSLQLFLFVFGCKWFSWC